MSGSERLRLFPLNTVLFPGAALNLHIFEPRYRQMIAECLDGNEAFGVVLIREGEEAGDPAVQPHEIGTTARIAEVTPLPSGRYYIRTVGGRRFRISRIVSREPYLLGEVEYLDDGQADTAEVEPVMGEIAHEFREYVKLIVSFSGTPSNLELPDDPLAASFAIGDALQVADTLKQQLLELADTRARLDAELSFLRRLLPQLRTLLQRKRERERERERPKRESADGEFRAYQEKFFGKHFSRN
jgi:Lon protease-like protein